MDSGILIIMICVGGFFAIVIQGLWHMSGLTIEQRCMLSDYGDTISVSSMGSCDGFVQNLTTVYGWKITHIEDGVGSCHCLYLTR